MHPAGKNFKATLIETGLREDKNGQTQPYLKFRTEHGEITWFGSLSTESSTDFAVKQLIRAGFFAPDFDDLKRPMVEVFEPIPLVISVEHKEYNGKVNARLTFVNPEHSVEKKEFKGHAPRMAAAFAKARKELGVTVKQEESPF